MIEGTFCLTLKFACDKVVEVVVRQHGRILNVY